MCAVGRGPDSCPVWGRLLKLLVVNTRRAVHVSWESCAAFQNIIDGDLCESFALLPADAQKRIAEDFEKTPADLLKQLDDIRNRIL